MKRAAAILLLSVFSFLLIAPFAVPLDGEAQLPACCRTRGSHHCAATSANHSAGPSFQAENSRCPLFPQAGALSSHHQTVTLTAPPLISGGIANSPAVHARKEALYNLSYRRTSQNRGPPPVIS